MICSLTDYIRLKHRDDIARLINLCLKNRIIDPYPYPGAKNTALDSAVVRKVYAHMNDDRSVRTDTVIEAQFRILHCSGYISHRSGWYRIQGTFRAENRSNFFESISPYRKNDIPAEKAVSEYLIPYISRKDLDTEAGAMLSEFLPEALETPVKINTAELAGKMGFTVRNARLSDDNSVLGRIYFQNSGTELYAGGKPYTAVTEAGTILIDSTAHKARKRFTDDTVIHECVHIYEHRMFYRLQCMFYALAGKLPPDFEDMVSGRDHDDPLSWTEHQAHHMIPRIRMPPGTSAQKAAELFAEHSDLSASAARKKVISELAEFFSVSVHMAENRLSEIGYDTIYEMQELIGSS